MPELRSVWDPIGLGPREPADEYDAYVADPIALTRNTALGWRTPQELGLAAGLQAAEWIRKDTFGQIKIRGPSSGGHCKKVTSAYAKAERSRNGWLDQ
ncbi:hypothetical protein ABID82_006540 [Methylobacterium sp. PvP062]|uniref:Uncharacterized protein n=1 Tax=Methylobacterium radiotolerans TaxID=31998 RepID=A0ABV2NT71_9HYPH|nr:hypothetical protein [Methylobacterium sp. PvP105]MBP2505533.1 hypothetical protein [Methylobacterium sp. PvP109]